MTLVSVMYHYVRDPAGTRYPGLHALSTEAFRDQVDALGRKYEMATLDRALGHLRSEGSTDRPLCLLTFDDGLAEHASFVCRLLAERGLQGVFLVPTACIEEGVVLPVHQNHLLLAHLGLSDYRAAFLAALRELGIAEPQPADAATIARTYRWDTPEAGAFKYLVNYGLDAVSRERALSHVFSTVLGEPRAIAAELYTGWDALRSMQEAGMIIGGHTHTHPVLSSLGAAEQRRELSVSLALLKERLHPQPLWPFAYPFGRRSTFDDTTLGLLDELGYACAFSTEVGHAEPGAQRMSIPRVDTKDA